MTTKNKRAGFLSRSINKGKLWTAGLAALATASAANAQVTLPDIGVDTDEYVNATVTEVGSSVGPAIGGGLILFAVMLGIGIFIYVMKKGKGG